MAGNRGFRWVRSDVGGQCPIIEVASKISQTIYKGNVLRLSATAGHGSVGPAAETDTVLFGYAVGDWTTTATETNTKKQVVPFIPGHVYEAVGAKSTMTSLGPVYRNAVVDLEVSTTGYSRIDTGGSIKAFRVVGWPKDNETATGAGRRWYLQILATVAGYNFAVET